MNLGEILTYVSSDVLQDRTDLITGDPDSLWSDRVIVGFCNEGMRRLARVAWLLQDIGNPTAGQITLVLNNDTYPLHKSVLRVYSATPADSLIPLGRSTLDALTYRNAVDMDYFDANAAFTRAPGRPGAFATDAGVRMLKLNRAPDATSAGLVLNLKVARLPLVFFPVPASGAALSTDALALVPEFADEYHQWIGDYAAGRCLTLPHVDPDRKADGRKMLNDFAAMLKEARDDRQRAEMAPGQFCFNSTTAYINS